MSDFFGRIGEFVARLLGGGTLEIVLLIVLIVVAVILLLVALWILWKLLVLLGKGLLFGFRAGSDMVRKRSAANREERLASPPRVATGWGSSPRIGLRKAIAEASRLVGPEPLRIVIVAGDGMADLCRSLGLTPPAIGTVGIAAGGDVILIDASKTDSRTLRSLATTLPWRRPTDGVAAVIDAEGIPAETLVRASAFARAAGLRVALHFAVGGTSQAAAWRIVDASNRDGGDLCAQLGQDAARIWLAGGSRDGLRELSSTQRTDLSTALDRALAAAPSSRVDIASLSLGGPGLRSAVAYTAARTRPAETPGLSLWLGIGTLAAGVLLAAVVAVAALDRSADLRATTNTAAREAATPWLASGVEAVPSGSRVRRVAGVGARLAGFSEFSPLSPLSPLVPNHGAPARLGGALLDVYVLRPLAVALDRRARERLEPSADPAAWIGDAQEVGEWLAAWEGIAEDPREVDLRRLLADGFGGDPESWPEGLDIALRQTDATVPEPAYGGLDVDDIVELARQNFINTMQRWAGTVYTDGPAARAARRAVDRAAGWRAQHEALSALRVALQDPGQAWLTAAEDRPDYGFELRMLGRALALSVLSQASVLEAKAAVSRIRIDAREAAAYFILPDIGPLMVRSSSGTQGGGGGPSLVLSRPAQAWASFLDRLANAGLAEVPAALPRFVAGGVTIDPAAVTATSAKLRTFDRFSAELPANLPEAVAGDLLREVASELVIDVPARVEHALRPARRAGPRGEDAERLGRIHAALEELKEIEDWLRQRVADDEADRVLGVRARIADNVLAAGAEVLAGEDPLGVYLDPSADANALARRFERGVVRLRRLYGSFGAPYIDAAIIDGSSYAFEWRDIGTDIAAYDRGEPTAALSGLEGMLRAFADDAQAACAAPHATHAAARDDYVARALERFRVQVDRACAGLASANARRIYAELKQYFSRNVAWMWPYSKDANAPEIQSSTLGEFVARLGDATEALAQVDGAFVGVFERNAAFWSRGDDDSPALRFRVEWRARPDEERLAEHVIEIEFDGVERDEGGVYTWRYGTPASLRLRLAKNSPYRFAVPADPDGLEFVVGEQSNGAMLRIFESLSNGAFEVATDVVDAAGDRVPMRVTARVGEASGAALTMPSFTDYPAGAVDPDEIQ